MDHQSFSKVDSSIPLMHYDRIVDPDLDHPKGTHGRQVSARAERVPRAKREKRANVLGVQKV